MLAHTPGYVDQLPTLGLLLKGVGEGEVNGLSLTSAQGRHILAWSVKNPFGETEGFVLMDLPWMELERLRAEGRNHLILGISGISVGFLILSMGLFRLSCRDLELSLGEMDHCTDRLLAGQDCVFQRSRSSPMAAAFTELARRLGRIEQSLITPPEQTQGSQGFFSNSNFRVRILSGTLLLLLGSCVASTTVGYLIFRDIYLPVLYSESRIIGHSLVDLVSEMHAHGIPVEGMKGVERIFSDLMTGYPQIAAIGLYDAKGRRLHALQRPGLDLPPASSGTQARDGSLSITIPISDQQTLIGMIRLDEVPHFFAKRLLDIALDVIALLVVSVLIAAELLTFIVRFLVAVPIEGLLRELRGEPPLAYAVPAILAYSVIHRIGLKIRSLLAQVPTVPPQPGMPALQANSSSLMPSVRPPVSGGVRRRLVLVLFSALCGNP